MKQPITITIRDREFRVSFVSNFFSVNYYAMKQEMLTAQTAYVEMNDAQERMKEGKLDPEAAVKIVEAAKDKIITIGSKEFFERRLDLVREACESNDIEYDRRFWERRTSPGDLVTFLDEVYLYGVASEGDDAAPNTSKKKFGK